MFDYESPKPKESRLHRPKNRVLASPVFLLITLLINADVGLAACIVFGMIMLAIEVRWDLRKHVWFWATIAFILALHVPLVFMVRWPQGNGPTLLYAMPIGIADFLIILGAVGLAERFVLERFGFIKI